MGLIYDDLERELDYWCHQLGVSMKGKRLDYKFIDRQIANNVPDKTIAENFDVSINTIIARRINHHGIRKYRVSSGHHSDPVTYEPTIPPLERYARLIAMKIAGWEPAHRAAFLGGLAHRQTVEGLHG